MTGAPKSKVSGHRFLLTGVVSRYALEPTWNREELAEDLDRMIDLFTAELGYVHVPLMGLDPTWLQVQDALRDFSTDPSRHPEDYVVVYLAGHGDVLQVGAAGAEHVLLPSDAVPADPYRRVIKSADLAHWLLAGTKVHRLLVLMDTCFSGQGGIDFAANAAAWAGNWSRSDTPDASGVVMVSSTWPKQEALPGAFTRGFVDAVRSRAAAGHGPGSVAVDAVVGVMNADLGLPATQRAQLSVVAGNGPIPDFLPNPRRDATLVDLDLDEQARRWRWRRVEEVRRVEELRGQFIPKTSGFLGRAQALSELSGWLRDAADARPAVVTGDPGSGKTAVLGLLAALSDPQRRPTISRDGLPAAVVPRSGLIDVAIYAGNLSAGQVLAGLAAAAGLQEPDMDPAAFDAGVARLLAGLRDREQPLTVMIDALDEAADPPDLAGRLLRPLAERGRGVIRLLLGTRRHVCVHLGPAWPGSCLVVDLDTTRYADPASLVEVIRRALRRGDPDGGVSSPFAACPPQVLEDTAGAIAEAAGRSFFVARILAATQAARPGLPNPADPAWRAGLPREAGPAMRRDLETRLSEDADQAIRLLRPLAYAQGVGLPWEEIWAMLATELDPGHRYSNEDLLRLTARVGAYVAESGTLEGRSLYRLYHRSLAEYLLHDRNRPTDQHAIATALARHVPLRPNGGPDWAAAHPYTRAYLAAHAAAGGMIDELSQDPGFLLAASAPTLLDALTQTASTPGRVAADAYRRALPFLRAHQPSEHPAYLALAARCGRAPALADRVTADELASPWRPLWASWQLRRSHQIISGHGGDIHAVAVAELAGRPVVVSGSDDATVRVWDLATGALIGDPLAGHSRAVNAVAVAELDGRPVVVSGGGDGAVRVWDLATGAPIGHPFTGHDGVVLTATVAELSGHPVVISGSDDATVRVWDLATGATVGDPLAGHDADVITVAVAELAGRPVVVSGGGDGAVRVWDLTTGIPAVRPLTGHGRAVNAVAVAELDGRPVVVSGSGDRTVRVWDLATSGTVSDPFTGHDDWVWSVAVAELDGRPVVVSGSGDRTVRVWDLATGAPVGDPFTGHDGDVNAVAVTELGGRPVVISGSDDATVRVWNLVTGVPVGRRILKHGSFVATVAVAELDGRPVVVSGSGDRTIRVWDLATGTPVGEPLIGHHGHVYAVTVSELDGSPVIASGSDDATVRVWDLATGAPIGNPLAGHARDVNAVAIAELGGRPVVVSASDDRTIRTWDLATRSPIGDPFTGHDGDVHTVAAAELDGRPVVISGGGDGTVRVWDLATGIPASAPLIGHDGVVNAVAMAELDGRPVIVSGGDDATVRVWDLATGSPVGDPFTGHGGDVNTVAAAEMDGRPVVVSGGGDKTVRVWDLATGALLGDPFTGHDDWVRTVAVAELDGRPLVVSGGDDKTVRVWDLATGAPLGDPFTGHDDWVRTVAVAELDGRPLIVSGGDDQTVRVWDLATRTSIADKLASFHGGVNSAIVERSHQFRAQVEDSKFRAVICAADRAVFLDAAGPSITWKQMTAIQIGRRVLAAAWYPPNVLIMGTEGGIAVLQTAMP